MTASRKSWTKKYPGDCLVPVKTFSSYRRLLELALAHRHLLLPISSFVVALKVTSCYRFLIRHTNARVFISSSRNLNPSRGKGNRIVWAFIFEPLFVSCFLIFFYRDILRGRFRHLTGSASISMFHSTLVRNMQVL